MAERIRDAARSREALLTAAEEQFAAHGLAGASVQDIGRAAGLSRGAPNYFFGSKDALYEAVLERVFAARDAAVREAFAPLTAGGELRASLDHAVRGYLRFLRERPSFTRIVRWESLDADRPGPPRSRAAEEAFASLPGDVDVSAAVLTFTALCFFPAAFAGTFSSGLDQDAHVALVVDVLLGILAG